MFLKILIKMKLIHPPSGRAIAQGIEGITSIIKPVFYQDNEHTLFIEPNVTERTIEEWQEWVPGLAT